MLVWVVCYCDNNYVLCKAITAVMTISLGPNARNILMEDIDINAKSNTESQTPEERITSFPPMVSRGFPVVKNE